MDNILNNTVNMDFFNKMLIKGGGRPIKSSKKQININELIKKLLKIFKKTFKQTFKNKSHTKKGGATFHSYLSNSGSDYNTSVGSGITGYNSVLDTKYSYAYNYDDLNFSKSSVVPGYTTNVREVL